MRGLVQQQIMAHSRLAASGKMIRKGNIRITKNHPASGRLRAIFAERYQQLKNNRHE